MDSNQRYSRYFTYIKPILRNRTVKTYSSLVFSIITITIFTLYAIQPTLKTIVTLQKTTDEHRKILEDINLKVKNLTDGKENLNKIDKKTKDKLDTLLPPQVSLPSLIELLTGLAQSHQASISGLQFQPTVLSPPKTTLSKKAAINEVEFILNVQGSNANLTKFLDSLTHSQRLITIESVNFSKPLDQPLILSITAKAYHLKN